MFPTLRQANEWPKVFATSPALSISSYLIFRGVLAAIFLVHLAIHIYIYVYLKGEGWFYIAYQSRQALVLQTVAMAQQFVAGVVGLPKLPKTNDSTEPLWVKAAVFLDYYIQPLSFGITWVYWGVLAFTPEDMKDRVEMTAVENYLAYFVHGINWVLLLVSFFLSRIPFDWSGLVIALVLGAFYILWTYVHFLLQLGVPLISCHRLERSQTSRPSRFLGLWGHQSHQHRSLYGLDQYSQPLLSRECHRGKN